MLVALAVVVVLLVSAAVPAIDIGWAMPLFVGGLVIAIIGAAARR